MHNLRKTLGRGFIALSVATCFAFAWMGTPEINVFKASFGYFKPFDIDTAKLKADSSKTKIAASKTAADSTKPKVATQKATTDTSNSKPRPQVSNPDTTSGTLAKKDTPVNLHYPYKVDPDNPYKNLQNNSMDLKNPKAIDRKPTLDSSMQDYNISSKVGGQSLGDDQTISYDSFQRAQNKQFIQDYFKRRSLAQGMIAIGASSNPINGLLHDFLPGPLNGLVDIRPQGTAELIFSGDFSRVQNPTWPLSEQRTSQFKFDQKIQISVVGNIGDKIKMAINYNTEAAFDFENQRKLAYQGKDDEIIKSIEVGDVTMPISGQLISGSSALFGVKTQLQFGRLFVTGVFSQQKSQSKEITVDAGAQKNTFSIQAEAYQAYQHYYLSQYHRSAYDEANRRYPIMPDMVITRIEVWVTNDQQAVTNTRNILALADLGENKPYTTNGFDRSNTGHLLPSGGPIAGTVNQSNTLYQNLITSASPAASSFRSAAYVTNAMGSAGFNQSTDYTVVNNARMLGASEYTYNAHLGFISLNKPLTSNQVMAVAYQYQVAGVTYQVGEFSTDVAPNPTSPNVLYVKMLKNVTVIPGIPLWDLMMKNVYSLNAYGIQSTNFQLQVAYLDSKSGALLNYLPVATSETKLSGVPLIQVEGLDKFDAENNARPDGVFDFIEGVNIVAAQGRIIFPVVEPFGRDLQNKFLDTIAGQPYIYSSLYKSTVFIAQQQPQANKYFLAGTYQSASGSDINLNAINVPQGSVKVYAGGVLLTENVDYIVDYSLGRVKIINSSVLAGSQIKVDLESNNLFSLQQKTLMGTRAEYKFNKDFTLGTTLLYLRERPITPKVTIGDEPIRNTILGFDGHYHTDSRLITTLVDKIPLIQTKEKSNFAADFEYAHIYPGHPKLLNDPNETGGVSYIDDFEAAELPYDLRLNPASWYFASTPPSRFPTDAVSDGLDYNYHRAKLAWYTIDPLFWLNNNLTPDYIKANPALQSGPYVRQVLQTEVFPNLQLATGVPATLSTFDLAYYPYQRGPYNYNPALNDSGRFSNPAANWGGVMRPIQTTDFEAANIDYMEAWLMDPFIGNHNAKGGQLYIDLGDVSEDILKDGQHSYENGLPNSATIQNVDTTIYGRIPTGIQINNAFDNDPNARPFQDIGLDGLSDNDERAFFSTTQPVNPNTINQPKVPYLKAIQGVVTNANALASINADPSADDFQFYRGDNLDAAKATILVRYKNFNNSEGNTPINVSNNNGYGSLYPDDEDINHDFTISTLEEYFEYRIDITPAALRKVGGYVSDSLQVPVTTPDKRTSNTTWYQFKIPIQSYSTKYGQIQDFKSIRFMRMYLTGFTDSVVLRFAELELVRSDWRKYQFNLNTPGEYVSTDRTDPTLFNVSTVSIEANGERSPINYVLPPGVQRQIDPTTPNQIQQNEQSLQLQVCDLQDGDARAVYKNVTFDVRQYKHMKMYIHAEGSQTRDAHVFIRLGTDFNTNYYEYDQPIYKVTPNGTTDVNTIWPDTNNMDVVLANLVTTKENRQLAGVSLTTPFSQMDAGHKGKITVLGNPDLGNIRTIMIGIRNPKNDGQTLCTIVWVDELRVTDFNEQGGWAAIGHIGSKLADLGKVDLTGSITTVGYGGLDQTLQQRSLNNINKYDFLSSFELGKFFPKNWNLRIPMYFAYGQSFSTPEYDPLSPDIPLDELINQYAGNKQQQDSVKNATTDYVMRKSLSFTNVKKERKAGKKKTHPWDVENIYATYAFTENYESNVTQVYGFIKNYDLILGYNYAFNPHNYQPFKKVTKSKYAKLLTDFNFYLLPQSFAFNIEGVRKYGELLYRNTTPGIETILTPEFDKNFAINRKYDLQFNFAKSLRLSFSALANARVDEPYGAIDSKLKQDTIIHNIEKLGTLTRYTQTANLSYDVPINKIPFLDFVTLQTIYASGYDWIGAPPSNDSLGNTIDNSQTRTVNLQLNLVTLYNKSEFFKTIIQNKSNVDRIRKLREEEQKKANPKDTSEIHVNVNAIHLEEGLARVAMMVRNASFSYTNNRGIVLPGFLLKPQAFGNDFITQAPGLPFVFGSQQNIQENAVRKGWITTDTNLTAYYINSNRKAITAQATLEPIKSLRITIDANQTQSTTYQETFRYVDTPGAPPGFAHLGGYQTGTFSTSFLPFNTAFQNPNTVYQQFESDRKSIATRLWSNDPRSQSSSYRTYLDSNKFPLGYGREQSDVLMYSLLAAYTGKSASSTTISNPFPSIPMPNWRISYTGLTDFPAIKQYIKSVTLSSAYRSTYIVSNFKTNLDYDPNASAIKDSSFAPKLLIDNISMSEQFSPLLGIDINWVNSWTSRIEYKRDRLVNFSFTNLQMSETDDQGITLGAGYRTNKLLLPAFIRFGGKRVFLKNDINFRLDFSYTDQKTLVRILDENNSQATAGQKVLSIKPDITYTVSKSLSIRIFFTRVVNTPYTSNNFPTADTNFGFSLRYTLTP